MYREMCSGLRTDPARHLRVTFPEQYDEIVLVRDISFTSMCEHHLLPFVGVAHVAYIPHGRVTGLSKLARVVDEVARRPQVQERMTGQIADLVERELDSQGVAVIVSAEHSCMSIRGIRKPGSRTVTSALRGVFKSNASSRAEVMALINQK
jgi:GTP cyclohydrolase I